MMAEQGSQAQRRAASIARHVTAAKGSSPSVAAADSARPAPSGGAGALSVVDERTGRRYSLKISEDGTVRSADLKQITAGGDGNGIKMFDPGCTNTATCRSTVSFIDGGKGVLRYRGIPIEALAEKSTYLETAYLLQYGHLPSRAQLASWEEAVMRHSALPDGVAEAVAALPHDAHFMATIITALTALSAFHPEQNPALQGGGIYKSKEIRDKQVVRIIGKMPALAALAYHRRSGRALCMPPPGLGYAESFLYMLDGMGRTDYRPHPRLARALEVLFILHAEHEMNCSTAACRHLASSGVDVYTAVAGAVGALYGPLHGGANEAVLKMLVEIGSPERIPEFLEGVKAGQRRLSGFGHRVYKNYDPRAKIIRGLAEEVFSIVGRDPLIEVAVALEQAALKDEYFVKRKLYPNVDFYSGLIYRALGFPPEFFTVLFAIPRAAGYLAHWRESLDDSDTKIVRPHQVYQGNWLSGYLPLDARETATEAPDMAEIPVSNATKRRIAGLAI